MKEHATGSALVGEPGSAMGIVSEADVVRKVVALGKRPESVMVDEIMSTPLISICITTPVYQIYRTMADNRIRHLIITEEGRQVGFVSVKDLLKHPMM